MSKKKYMDRHRIAGTVPPAALSLLFMNGEAFGLTKNDLKGSWNKSSAVKIVMEGDNGTVSGNGAGFQDGNLVIDSPGKYVISGTLDDGSIIVDLEKSDKVWIMLDGVDIFCRDDACFRVDEADKVFLTLAKGSGNRMESGEKYSKEALLDGTGGVIFSHDDLTVNGSGSLTIEGGSRHGIESNDDLVIAGGIISITCEEDGMNANDRLEITEASITVNAGDDALHCEKEVCIQSGTILMESCYEGIEASKVTIDGGDITIYPLDDGINADGSLKGRADELPVITVNGGTVTVINEKGRDADGLDSNGDIIINGGSVFISMDGSGGSNGLDCGIENGGQCVINGGVVAAFAGSTKMVEISDESEQCTLMYVLDETISAGAAVSITDTDGSTIMTGEVPCGFSSLVYSSPKLQRGKTYTLSAGADETKIYKMQVVN